MIEVIIPTQIEFEEYKDELKQLYLKNQDKICDPNSFEFICNKTFFYVFVKNKQLIGAIYYFVENSKLYLNAFSNRKCFSENLDCLKISLSWFEPPIYAEAQNRASALCLLRVGFRRVRENLFVYG